MANQNSSNTDININADGFSQAGGTTKRKLTLSGADVAIVGSGTNVYTMPSATDTLVGRASTDTLTNKDLSSATNIMPSGSVVGFAGVTSSAVATGASTIPLDDTIPQNTEGTEFMTLSITPKSSSNTLVIEVIAYLASDAAAFNMNGAVFQDSGANALVADSVYGGSANASILMTFRHIMPAGTTSATTFKFRGGANTGTTSFNGRAGGRNFGAITKSTMTITEYKA